MRKLNNIPVWRITLIIMGVVFITAHMSAGIYAKYASELGGTSTVSVAKFDGGSVTIPDTIQMNFSTSTVTVDGTHVFVAGCEVTFAACEVSREFNLTVTTDDEGTSFKCPEGDLYTLKSCGGSSAFAKADVGCPLDVVSGKAYVGLADITDGQVNYTWYEATVSDDGKTLSAVVDQAVTMNAEKYSVRIVYFKNLTNASDLSEITNISFGLKCEQVD